MQETRANVEGVGGVRLAVRSFPAPSADAPALLLMHGLASSQHIWDLMLPRLVKRFRVVAYDARGHGLSGKPTSGYGFETVRGDARAVIRAMRLRRPVVAGHSWGAMVALEMAARDVRSIGGAVLIDGGLTRIPPDVTWAQARARLAPPHLAGMPAEEFRGMIRHFFADAVHVTPDVENIVMAVMRIDRQGRIHPNLSRANHFRILHAIFEQDPFPLLARLKVPTLAIAARPADPSDPDRAGKMAAVATARAAAGPNVPLTISWMDGIHDLPLQHPAALAGRIERFAAKVGGGSA